MAEFADLIHLQLGEIENRENVRLVYAYESGSRAWGFPSSDSDYDVRFIYIHPVEWYLSIGDQRDVIELPVEGQLDINGWDIRKALRLFRNSNPPLLEWLNSPIVYLESFGAVSRLRQLATTYYSPAACIYHYLHMAQGNFRQYLQGEQVWLKKYFYVLRPILAINWIERGYGVAPTSFGVLVDRLVTAQPLHSEIANLIELKQKGAELDHGPRITAISEYIESELSRLESISLNNKGVAAPVEELNRIFLDTLAAAWGERPEIGFGSP